MKTFVGTMAAAALQALKLAMDGVTKGTAGADTESVLPQVHDMPFTSTAAPHVTEACEHSVHNSIQSKVREAPMGGREAGREGGREVRR